MPYWIKAAPLRSAPPAPDCGPGGRPGAASRAVKAASARPSGP